MNDERKALLRTTTIYEAIRSCMVTPMAAAFRGSGLAVLVALQFFHGADWQKGLLAAAPFFGMVMSPFAVNLATRLQVSVSRLAGIMTIAMVPGLLLAALATSITGFSIGILLSVPMLGAVVPLSTALWQQNAPAAIRGRRFGRVTLIGAVAAVASTSLISVWLGDDPGRYRPVMACFTVMAFVAGLALLRIPTQPLKPEQSRSSRSGLHVLSLIFEDRFFGYLCIAQMLIGVGNLATIPLRTEFLGSVERGMGYMAGTVFLIAVVIPEISRLASLIIWGWLFDHLNFAVMRISVSCCFVLSLLCTFTPLLPLQILGAVFYGAATGGGNIAWSLWVTKLAPEDRTADYMAVHTFLTGTRGLIAPQLSFAALAIWSIHTVGMVAVGMILVSIVMLTLVIPRFSHVAADPTQQ